MDDDPEGGHEDEDGEDAAEHEERVRSPARDAVGRPCGLKPGALSRFNPGRKPVELTLVEPVVAEVSADTARVGGSFRHAVRFVRLRSDLESP